MWEIVSLSSLMCFHASTLFILGVFACHALAGSEYKAHCLQFEYPPTEGACSNWASGMLAKMGCIGSGSDPGRLANWKSVNTFFFNLANARPQMWLMFLPTFMISKNLLIRLMDWPISSFVCNFSFVANQLLIHIIPGVLYIMLDLPVSARCCQTVAVSQPDPWWYLRWRSCQKSLVMGWVAAIWCSLCSCCTATETQKTEREERGELRGQFLTQHQETSQVITLTEKQVGSLDCWHLF